MEIGKSALKRSKLENNHLIVSFDDYDDDLSFYSFPPTGKIDLIEVEEMVEERMAILEVFDELKIDTAHNKNLGEYLNCVRDRIRSVPSKFGDNFVSVTTFLVLGDKNVLKKEARRRDQISHFLLRLYFCHPPEKKAWFVAKETELLKFRLLELSRTESARIIPKLIRRNGLNYEPVVLDPHIEFDKELKKKANFSNPFLNDDKGPIYRIKFEEALDVVRSRRAYLFHGHAYVTTHDMISLICTKFRNELSTAMSRLYVNRPDEENRLLPMINKVYLHKIESARRKLQTDSSGKMREIITPDMIDQLSKESFPPCMENIHLNLRNKHHIKYGGRLHYGLFLKGIGLQLEDAIKFFRDEFVLNQKILPEKFDKEYRYGIRYNYGKEGKKVDFSPYGCEKIIATTPGTADVHGCPFKHFDAANLKKFLRGRGVSDEVIDNINGLVEEKAFTRACSIYFSVRHPNYELPPEGITHPNQFYTESRKALRNNPNREDLMVDEEIDHFTGSLLPEEIEVKENINNQDSGSLVNQIPDIQLANEDSQQITADEIIAEIAEPMDVNSIASNDKINEETKVEDNSTDPDESDVKMEQGISTGEEITNANFSETTKVSDEEKNTNHNINTIPEESSTLVEQKMETNEVTEENTLRDEEVPIETEETSNLEKENSETNNPCQNDNTSVE